MRVKNIRRANLLVLIEEHGQQEVIRRADISPSLVSQLKSTAVPKGRRTPKGIGDEIAGRLERAFGKPHGWMDQRHDLAGEPRGLRDGGVEVPYGGPVEVSTTRQAPLVSWENAGRWSEIMDHHLPIHSVGPPIEITQAFGERTFALQVRDDTMEPRAPEGAVIIVDPGRTPRPGSLVVARLKEEAEPTFKKLVVDGPRRYLAPLNPRYPILEGEIDEVVGVVCQVVINVEVP
jgi:SOS-response transcriptional repressor LexA